MKPIKITEPRIVLPDTSLCAIVRDEIINPAGGIKDFVSSTVPFVERAVIVDTGSVDGTREMLEELQAEYANLEVYDTVFEGFAHARNESLKHCKTRRALILDADERLTRVDFERLKLFINVTNAQMYNFLMLCVQMNGTIKSTQENSDCLNPRIFDIHPRVRFDRLVWEQLFLNGSAINIHDMEEKFYTVNVPSTIRIKHFPPSNIAINKKHELFYKKLEGQQKTGFLGLFAEMLKPATYPSLIDLGIYDACKKYNPMRENYR